ncbi:MAG TPA: ABC transporter permease [Desulfobacteraceae bacterium]|nr:ABC transporter permease [Desulfobacteraceae bacterium]
MLQRLTQKQRIWLTFKRNKTAVVGLVIGLLIVLMAILAPWISPMDPLDQDAINRLSWGVEGHLLGTDDFGRDVLSRIIWGSRVSLMIGGASVLLGLLAGTTLGMVAGYFRGKIETAIMRSVDVMMSFPDLILAIAVTAALGANLGNLIITIGIVMTPRFARMAYGSVISIKESDYVLAAGAIGARTPRILFRHVFPNIFGELLVAGTLWVGEAIRLEANLAFIGLGVQPPTPTWGNMTREGIDVLINAPWISIFAGLSILITILSFNMLGDGIRDITDPKLRGGEGKEQA